VKAVFAAPGRRAVVGIDEMPDIVKQRRDDQRRRRPGLLREPAALQRVRRLRQALVAVIPFPGGPENVENRIDHLIPAVHCALHAPI